MNVRLQLEELEDRSVPSVADLAAFQQQLPQLTAQFQALIPMAQSSLQTSLNQQREALAPLVPATFQPQLAALFAQQQQVVNAFPTLANIWFQQTVANIEAQLLAQSTTSSSPISPTTAGVIIATL